MNVSMNLNMKCDRCGIDYSNAINGKCICGSTRWHGYNPGGPVADRPAKNQALPTNKYRLKKDINGQVGLQCLIKLTDAQGIWVNVETVDYETSNIE